HDLPGGAFRQLGQHRDAPRALVAGHALLAPRDQVVRGDDGAGAQRDERRDLFAELAVRHADDGGLRHRGMRAERGLDLRGIDGIAAAQDQVLLAADDAHETLVRHAHEIARAKPAVDERRGGFLRLRAIAVHRRVASAQALAGLTVADDSTRVAHDSYVAPGDAP